MKFSDIFRLLVRFFEKEKIDYALIGAFALQAYGYVRATRDVDFIVRAANQGKIISHLESTLGYETLHRSPGYSNHAHALAGLGRIDFLYVRGTTAESIFGQTRRLPVLEDLRLPVVKLEHLVALKVFAMKNDPERALKEMSDIKALIDVTNIDPGEIRQYFETYGQLERYHDIIGGNRDD